MLLGSGDGGVDLEKGINVGKLLVRHLRSIGRHGAFGPPDILHKRRKRDEASGLGERPVRPHPRIHGKKSIRAEQRLFFHSQHFPQAPRRLAQQASEIERRSLQYRHSTTQRERERLAAWKNEIYDNDSPCLLRQAA